MEVGKIKRTLFIGCALLIAGGGFAVLAQSTNESDENIFQDFDQDGLSNEEEQRYGTDPYKRDTDFDGYSDYTEISSGYDPLKPAPGDKIIKDGSGNGVASGDLVDIENLTERAVTQLASVVTSSELDEMEITVENIDTLVQEALSAGVEDIELPNISEDDIIMKDQDYDDLSSKKREEKIQEDTEEYLTAITYILSTNMPENAGKFNNLSSWLEASMRKVSSSYASGNYAYISQMAGVGGDMLGQLKELEVPENMLSIHKKGLQLSYLTLELEETGQPDESDPLRNIVQLSRAQGLVAILTDFMLEVGAAVEETGMDSIDEDVFNVDFLLGE